MTPTSTLRLACFSVAAFAAISGLTACKTTCDSSGNCTSASTTQYVGTTTPDKATGWASGENIYVDIRGGTIREGDTASKAISITQGGDPANVHATFTPFISDTPDNKTTAVAELSNNLQLNVGPGTPGSDRFPTSDGLGAGVVVQVLETGSHETSLSAHVDLQLPSGFDGALYIHTDSGDVIINAQYSGHTYVLVDAEGKIDLTYGGGAAATTSGVRAKTDNGDIILTGTSGTVYAHSGLGDVEVDIGTATSGSDSGDIQAAQGDVTLKVPTASIISIQATSGTEGSVAYPNPLPAGWVDTPAAASSILLVGNGGTAAGNWVIDSSGFDSDNVEIDLQLATLETIEPALSSKERRARLRLLSGR